MVNGEWVVDPNGCQEIVVKRFRSEHEELCKYSRAMCPNNPGCIVKNRADLEKHIEEDCSYNKCPHAEFGCKIEAKIPLLKQHLKECHFEKVKVLLYKMRSEIESQKLVIQALREDIKNKDAELEYLKRVQLQSDKAEN